MNVPFLDLHAQYQTIKDEIDPAISAVVNQTAFAGGPFVEKFEKNWAAFCQTRHAVGMGSGTDALWIALLAAGVGTGDEVITASHTFIATAESITYCGATPVFVDIEETTCNMDPAKIEAAITPKTKAIIPVHIYGQTADMDPINEIAARNNLVVIEDACQAHGAEYKGKKAGGLGHMGCFSFYPGKNLGAYGEAGAVVTDDERLAEKMRVLRDHGQPQKYYHRVIGWNARMDGIQGAVLDVKLGHLDAWNRQRREHAKAYRSLLSGIDAVILPEEAENRRHVYHVYVIRTKNRDDLIANLKEKGINCAIHYPVPVHLQEAYRFMGLQKGSLPVTEKVASEIVSLPMYAELTPSNIEAVCEEIGRCCTK
jgi:dTDP-4-amino-4,6-dideoxygalactose transaminase